MAARDAARLKPRLWPHVAASLALLVGVPLVLLAFDVTPSPLGWGLLGALTAIPLGLAAGNVLRARRRRVLARA